MTDETDDRPDESGSTDAMMDALLADLLADARRVDEIVGPGFRERLLASFDDHQRRRRRNRLSLSLFADAFGWRALSRPLASAGILAGLCATGFIAGAAASPGDRETYAELAASLDQSFGYSEEDASWAEE